MVMFWKEAAGQNRVSNKSAYTVTGTISFTRGYQTPYWCLSPKRMWVGSLLRLLFVALLHRTVYRFIYKLVVWSWLLGEQKQKERKFAPLPFLSLQAFSHRDGVFITHPIRDYFSAFCRPLSLYHRIGVTIERECATPFTPGCMAMFKDISWASSTFLARIVSTKPNQHCCGIGEYIHCRISAFFLQSRFWRLDAAR